MSSRPRTQLLALSAATALTLAGCSGGTPTAAPSPTPSPTPPATITAASPTPAAPTTPAGPTTHKPGETVTSGIATAAYYAYKQPVAAGAARPATDGYTWGAIDIKVCIVGGTDATVDIDGTNWVLRYADDTTAQPSNIEYNQFPAPRYPYFGQVAKGSCVRGWLTFAVPPGSRPVTVEYQPRSGIVDWSVK
jgi:hypothetical protein